MIAERFDKCAFPGSRNTGDANPYRFAGMRDACIDDFLCLCMMPGQIAFDKRDGLAQYGTVMCKDPLHIFMGTECGSPFQRFFFQIRVHLNRLWNAVMYVKC